jgi:hypothetical protein
MRGGALHSGALVLGVLLWTAGCKRHRHSEALDAGALLDLSLSTVPVEVTDGGSNGEAPVLDVSQLAQAKTYTSLKEAKAHKESAAKLSLEEQDLSAVPGLSQLRVLQELDLSRNKLSDVPGLGALKRLERLDLSYNPLKRPPDLGSLSELTELDLDHTELATLPFDLGQLKKLRILHVGSPRLLRLPEELTDASSLRILTLRGCAQLAALPKEMGRLSQLTVLDLSGSRVPPDEVRRVQELLPHVQIQGAPLEGSDGGEEGQVESAGPDSSCDEIVKGGWQKYLAEPGTSLAKAVEHLRQCEEEDTAELKLSLSDAMRARLEALGPELERVENARLEVEQARRRGGEESLERQRLLGKAARAELWARVIRALSTGAPVKADESEDDVREALERLSDLPAPSEGADEYQQAMTALQGATDGLLERLQGTPPGLRQPVVHRLREVLQGGRVPVPTEE